MKLCGGFRGYDRNRRGDGPSSQCQVDTWASHRLNNDSAVREQGGKRPAQAIRVRKGISRKERIRGIETLQCRKRSDERANSGSKVLHSLEERNGYFLQYVPVV